MKPRSRFLRFTSLWLALLVLTASVGLTVQQHTCRVSGLTQRAVVLTPRHGCVPAEARQDGCQLPPAKATVQEGCCEFSAHHHKVDAPGHELGFGKIAVPALLAVLPAPAVWPATAAAPAGQLTQHILHAADASPPPRAGRALLTFVCVLVV